ncbi:MAG: HGxxPAAW family protein [Propionibacteriaceae bacterium]|nr:HGxxPAAW family protein [Propionibacteriaceae bacterium]
MSSAQRRHYHHGRSPAAWTGTTIACIGFILATVASVTGPNWTLVWVSCGLLLLALIVTGIMKKMGLGNG